MSKSILVIDTPKSCEYCRMCSWNLYDEHPSCNIIGTLCKDNFDEFRHPQCPLQDTTELLEKSLNEIHNSLQISIGNNKDKYNGDLLVEICNKELNKLYKALEGGE